VNALGLFVLLVLLLTLILFLVPTTTFVAVIATFLLVVVVVGQVEITLDLTTTVATLEGLYDLVVWRVVVVIC
jgi:hypothetical protein